MNSPIRGLHHVTATVTDAQDDLDFYAGALGQRLVKKTVNFDNTGVYHFYYGDERGTPGTIMTTFPYAGKNVRVGIKGAGQITATSFSVPTAALPFWRDRLEELGLTVDPAPTPFLEDALMATDPSGLIVRLLGSDKDTRAPWVTGGLTPQTAVRGIHSVSLTVRDPDATVGFLIDAFGAEVVATSGNTTRVGVAGEGPGNIVEVVRAPEAPDAINGLGTVHHVAFAVGNEDEQLAMREKLIRKGRKVTEVLDRQYFKSIYFREPNNVLYEIATVPPGFTADESVAELGTGLKLPPWEEARRAEIEAALPRVDY